jgi:hypothetical protein
MGIIAVETDVKRPDGHMYPFDVIDDLCKPSCKDIATRKDSHQREVLAPFVLLEDLMGHADERSIDLALVHYAGLF